MVVGERVERKSCIENTAAESRFLRPQTDTATTKDELVGSGTYLWLALPLDIVTCQLARTDKLQLFGVC